MSDDAWFCLGCLAMLALILLPAFLPFTSSGRRLPAPPPPENLR